jgi:hypothetical protein
MALQPTLIRLCATGRRSRFHRGPQTAAGAPPTSSKPEGQLCRRRSRSKAQCSLPRGPASPRPNPRLRQGPRASLRPARAPERALRNDVSAPNCDRVGARAAAKPALARTPAAGGATDGLPATFETTQTRTWAGVSDEPVTRYSGPARRVTLRLVGVVRAGRQRVATTLVSPPASDPLDDESDSADREIRVVDLHIMVAAGRKDAGRLRFERHEFVPYPGPDLLELAQDRRRDTWSVRAARSCSSPRTRFGAATVPGGGPAIIRARSNA